MQTNEAPHARPAAEDTATLTRLEIAEIRRHLEAALLNVKALERHTAKGDYSKMALAARIHAAGALDGIKEETRALRNRLYATNIQNALEESESYA